METPRRKLNWKKKKKKIRKYHYKREGVREVVQLRQKFLTTSDQDREEGTSIFTYRQADRMTARQNDSHTSKEAHTQKLMYFYILVESAR